MIRVLRAAVVAVCALSLAVSLPALAAAKKSAKKTAKKSSKKSAGGAGILHFGNVTVGDASHRPPAGHVHRVRVGKRSAFTPFHWAKTASDHPTVHYLTSSLYQNDQRFADLFSDTHDSEICGPTALGNVMLYLKTHHGPTYQRLFEHDGLAHNPNEIDVVHYLFRICHTDRNNGTTSGQLQACAGQVLHNAGYTPATLRVQSPVSPAMLRAASQTRWRRGAADSTSDKAVVLLFGWYARGTYQRQGGHFVALAGYDARDSNVFYVGNPLLDYPRGHAYSKIKLEPVPASAGMSGRYQTQHLFGDDSGVIAVLENMVEVLPNGASASTASAHGSSAKKSAKKSSKKSAKKAH